jgi:hypothetical protein
MSARSDTGIFFPLIASTVPFRHSFVLFPVVDPRSQSERVVPIIAQLQDGEHARATPDPHKPSAAGQTPYSIAMSGRSRSKAAAHGLHGIFQ